MTAEADGGAHHAPLHWRGMPAQAREALEKALERINEQLHDPIHRAWERLLPVIRQDGQSLQDFAAGTPDEAALRDVQYRYLLATETETPGLATPELHDEMRYAALLLSALGISNVPELILERHAPPHQSFPESFAEELALVLHLRDALGQLLKSIHEGHAKPLFRHDERVGALALGLILDSGVLSLDELRAAITTAQSEPIRVIRNTYYFYFRMAEAQGVVQEYRRPILTPLSVALIHGLGAHADNETLTDIKRAIRAIGRRLGFRGKQPLGVMAILRGAAARMRLQETVPQFVVDYAERRLPSHSTREPVWRRLMEVAPWPDGWLPEDATTRTKLAHADQTAGAPKPKLALTGSERGTVNQVRRILESALDSADNLDAVMALREEVRQTPDARPALIPLMDWLVALHKERGSHGKVRRPHTIRNEWQALASRLILICGDRPIESLEPSDWESITEQVVDEALSPKHRGSILYALHAFLTWLHTDRHLGPLPVAIDYGRAASNVNATIISRKELRFAISALDDGPLNAERPEDRQLQMRVLAMGYRLGARKREMLGLLPEEIHPGARPSIELRDNALRRLKTVSSERRSPLGLMQEAFVDQRILPLLQTAEADRSLLAPTMTDQSVDTVMRKLSEKLRTATDDDHASLHALRHSAATWSVLSLHASDLALARFVDEWPFVQHAVDYEPTARPQLLGNRGTLHSLHAVRGLLGHRNESMTVLHYIHFLDLMRYAAVTLMQPASELTVLLGAAGLTRFASAVRMTQKDPLDPAGVLQILETHRPGRVKRHDVPITYTDDQTMGQRIQHSSVLRTWMTETEQPESRSLEQQVVDLINDRCILGPQKKLARIDEIRPTARAELAMALGISESVADPDVACHDNRALAGRLLEQHYRRGGGKYSFAVDEAPLIIDWLEHVGAKAHFQVRVETETSRKEANGKSKRRFLSHRDLETALATGAKRVLLVPVWKRAGKRESMPHQAFVWAIAKIASR